MQIEYIHLNYFYFSMYNIGIDIALSFKKLSCYLDEETDAPPSTSPVPLEEIPSVGK